MTMTRESKMLIRYYYSHDPMINDRRIAISVNLVEILVCHIKVSASIKRMMMGKDMPILPRTD